MAVLILCTTHIYKCLSLYANRRFIKSDLGFLTYPKRNFFTKKFIPRRNSVLSKVDLTRFYNGSRALMKNNTYDNLVKQNFSGGSDKKCPDHPGRHNFHKEVETALNEQIEMEFNAMFTYLSMASYYGRSEVALPGCQGFFMMMHQEEHEHAIIFLNYILMRGGHSQIPPITTQQNHDWKDIPKTFQTAVQLECDVKEKLEELVEISEKFRDHQLIDFISGEFLEEQNRSIQTLSRLYTRSKMVNNDVGEYLFDQHLYDSFVKPEKDKNLMYTMHLPQEGNTKIYK
ncbi:hypothetical protein ABEB36_003996 [Hypothenemus hampei]|uniref:Ferritin n=1 Tax=Hypothenemus hampei TaxID=57062 RepID=A0ABD1F2F5_HYPHA